MKTMRAVGAASLVAALLGMSVFAAQRDERGTTAELPQPEPRLASPVTVEEYLEAVRQIRWRVNGEGRLEVAGVLRFELDDNGKAFVEVRQGGSFDSDPVVGLKLPLVVEPGGQLSLVGIERIGVRSDRIVIVVDTTALASEAAAGAAVKLAEDCHMRKPIDCKFPYCSGSCILGYVCAWKVVGQDLICKCVPPEE